MAIMQDALRLARQGAAVDNLPDGFQWFGQGQTTGKSIVVICAAIVFAAFVLGMWRLAAGRAVYAVGSDPEAARLAGIRPKRVVFWVFVLMGGLTAFAALLQAVRFAQVDTNSGLGLELSVIAAVVVGGTAVAGGRGRLLGSLFGVALLGTISAALIFLGGKPYWDKAIQGGIILLAVASDALQTSPRKAALAGVA
jgi:rhamnose transport system permease protein